MVLEADALNAHQRWVYLNHLSSGIIVYTRFQCIRICVRDGSSGPIQENIRNYFIRIRLSPDPGQRLTLYADCW